MSNDRSPLSRADILQYGAGSFGTGVFSTVPSALLLFYGTQTLGLAAGALAALILANKIWSCLWDPYVGAWSDGFRGKAGRRRPFMLVGGVGTALSFALLFGGPSLGGVAMFVWVAVIYFALATFYSLFAVPYSAVPADIAGETTVLGRLVSARMMFVMLGVLAGGAVAPAIVGFAGGGRGGYAMMGMVLGLASLFAMIPPVIMLRSRDRGDGGPSLLPHMRQVLAAMRGVFANRRFRWLALAFLTQACSFGSVIAALPYVITIGMGRSETEIGLAFAVYLGSTILAVPLWSMAARRLGMPVTIGIAACSYAVAAVFLACLIIVQAPWSVALGFMAVGGMPFAGLQVLPFTYAAEIARVDAPSAEARFAGVWTATEKLGLAGGAAAFGFTIDVAGRQASTLAGFLILFPALLCLLSLLLLRVGAAPARRCAS